MGKSAKKPIVDSHGRRITGGMCSGGCGYKTYLANGYCKLCWRNGSAKKAESKVNGER